MAPSGTRVLAVNGPVTVVQPPPPVLVAAGADRVRRRAAAAANRQRSPTIALRQRTRRRWLIAILVVLLLGLAAAAGGWWIGGRWAATPAAVGLTQSQAETLVRDAGLVPRVTVEHHNDVASGLVAQSDPVAGTEQLRGSEVDLLVSSGRPEVPAIPPGTDQTGRDRRTDRGRPDGRGQRHTGL